MAAASLLGSRPAGSCERGSWRQATSAMPPRAEMSYPSATLQEPARCPRPLPSMVRKAPRGLRPSARRRWRSIFDCSRAYIGKLEAEGVIQRQGDAFPLDQPALLTCDICGVVLTHLSNLPARCAPHGDLAIRRNMERRPWVSYSLACIYSLKRSEPRPSRRLASDRLDPPLYWHL